MKMFNKIFLAMSAILAVLVVAFVVLASLLITPERVKAMLLPLAEHKLHRKVDLGEIKVSLLSGIEIHGLTIYEQDGLDIFLSTDLVRLRYELLPLLTRQIVIDEVRLEKPNLRVVRLNNGQFNFSDLLASSSVPVGKPNEYVENTDASAINLQMSRFLLQDGHLVFIDRVLNDKAPYRYEFTALQVATKGGGRPGEVPVSIQCQINGSSMSLDGQVNLAPVGGTFDIDLQNVDVVPFMPYIQDKLPGKLGGLKMNLKSTVTGTSDEVTLKGSLSFVGLDLQFDAMPKAPLENARFDATYDLQFNLSQDNLELRALGLDYNGIMADVVGNVTGLTGSPSLDLAVTVPKLQIGQALNAVPQVLVGDLQSYDPTGSITIDASLFGSLVDTLGLLKSATVDLDNVQSTFGGWRPAFSGRLQLAGDQVSSKDLQIRLGDNNAIVVLKANGIYSKPITVSADFTSGQFLLEPLLQGSAGSVVSSDQTETSGNTTDSIAELGPFKIPLLAAGSIKIDETTWKELTIKNFQAQYELKDNIFKLIQMDGQIADGFFSNSARIDLGKKGLVYSINLGVKAVQADPLLSAILPKDSGRLWGTMDVDLFVNGSGTRWQTINRTLSGNGNILVTNGRIVSPDLVNGLGTFLHLPELTDIRFDNVTGQFEIVDGKVALDGQLISDSIKLYPKGNIGLDGALNLSLDTRLNPDLSAKMDNHGRITGYLSDNDGWTRLPLSLRGSYHSPVFKPDPKGVPEQASKDLSTELRRKIDEFFNPPKSPPQATGQTNPDKKTLPASDPASNALQDSLQKLFGH